MVSLKLLNIYVLTCPGLADLHDRYGVVMVQICKLGFLYNEKFFEYLLFLSSLLRNPIVALKHYRLYTIYRIPSLRILDFKKIKDKVIQKFSSYPSLIYNWNFIEKKNTILTIIDLREVPREVWRKRV